MSNPQATLFKLEVLLNTKGEIVLEASQPPDSKLVESTSIVKVGVDTKLEEV